MSALIGVSELVGIAQAGGSLKDTGFKHSVIGAVGMAAASGKTSYVLGCELHRLRCAMQAERWHYAIALFRKQLQGLARKDRWRKVNDQLLDILANYALREWLFDICVPCQGRGRIAIERFNPDGTKIEHACDLCGGSGKGKPAVKVRMDALKIGEGEYIRHWDRRFEDVLGVLDKAYGVAQRSIAKRLGRRVEDA